MSVSAVCHDFPKPFSNNRRFQIGGGVKNEICNYLLRPLVTNTYSFEGTKNIIEKNLKHPIISYIFGSNVSK